MAKMTPMKAIRKKCLECSCGSSHEVKLCEVKKCPLYAYRFGKRPKGEEDYLEDELDEKCVATCGSDDTEEEIEEDED